MHWLTGLGPELADFLAWTGDNKRNELRKSPSPSLLFYYALWYVAAGESDQEENQSHEFSLGYFFAGLLMTTEKWNGKAVAHIFATTII